MRRLLPALSSLALILAGSLSAADEPLVAPVAPDHWSRPLLVALRFPSPPGDAPEATEPTLATRFDVAVHLARWLERGLPTPEARPRLLVSRFRKALLALGLTPEEIARKLEERAPREVLEGAEVGVESLGSPRPPSQRVERTRGLLRDSLQELERIEDRIQALRDQGDRTEVQEKAARRGGP